jgi:uncharacterized membrane protein YdjX (TVP38/TMEM64 family)
MNKKRPTKKQKIVISIVLILLIAVFIVAYFILKANGWLNMFMSADAIHDYIVGFGVKAPLVFIGLQILQVIISPIPGNLTTLAGSILFGFSKGFWFSFIAIYIGSVLAFALARIFGKPLVIKLVGKNITHKYLDVMSSRQKVVLIFMFLLPFFPDDALCLIAGISGVSWPFFLVALALARPAGILFSALVGSGAINVPMWGWGIIIAISITIMVLSIRYSDKINDFAKRNVIDRFKKTKDL